MKAEFVRWPATIICSLSEIATHVVASVFCLSFEYSRLLPWLGQVPQEGVQ